MPHASEGGAVPHASEGGAVPHASECTLQINQAWKRGAQPLSTLLDEKGKRIGAACPVLHVRSNLYFAPVLARSAELAPAVAWLGQRGLGCAGPGAPSGREVSSGGEAEKAPFFGALSRHLFVPHESHAKRADAFIEQAGINERGSPLPTGGALIGVHVRTVLLHALHKQQQRNATTNARGEAGGGSGVLQTYGFFECISRLRAQPPAWPDASRVYIAFDSPSTLSEAVATLGTAAVLPPPPYLLTAREKKREKKRGVLSTTGACCHHETTHVTTV